MTAEVKSSRATCWTFWAKASKESVMQRVAGEDSAWTEDTGADAARVDVHPVTLTFYALRANEQVQVRLDDTSPAFWGDAFAGNRRVGISLTASPPGALLCVNRFVINRKAISISNNQDCAEIRVRLYVHDSDARIAGTISLPPGARMEMESLIDRVVNVRGSFSLNLR
ncbi:hypothetical protein [Trinickia acidisoli]|uniref:hypothetical protein n=1 Tax=Trinickia acidisoli TaxID=2767482 RepID=UPI001A8C56D5|nr:hypothetical protein [Trinickia acidisoli]